MKDSAMIRGYATFLFMVGLVVGTALAGAIAWALERRDVPRWMLNTIWAVLCAIGGAIGIWVAVGGDTWARMLDVLQLEHTLGALGMGVVLFVAYLAMLGAATYGLLRLIQGAEAAWKLGARRWRGGG
jgi:hypothetical protein